VRDALAPAGHRHQYRCSFRVTRILSGSVSPRTGTSFPLRLGVHPQCVPVHGDLADRFNRSWTRVDVLVTNYTDAAVWIPVREVISRFLADDSLAATLQHHGLLEE